ncbi:MAG TPA: CoA ester lyase [Sphingomonas sp.]|nr:CoA ester lyase [Sphingomonas sp.]
MTDSIHPMRSALFLPASNPRAIEKARGLATDVVILDLEDAVAPEAKVEARDAAVAAVNAGGFAATTLAVRVNALDTEWGSGDLAAVAASRANAVLVPKVATAGDVELYHAELAVAPPAMRLWAMIETCRAVSQLQEIADMATRTRLAAVVVGTNDLALELRARPAADRVGLMPYLALVVAAARAAGIGVLDGVCNDFADLDRFAAECAQGRALGFDGKSLIHPAQIAPCNAAFGPSSEEVTRARAIVAAFADPENAGKGVIRVEGRMVERLHLHEAERALALGRMVEN